MDAKEQRNEILEVHMFGGFTVYYGGYPVILGRRGTGKSVQLFQLLLIHREKGIAKEELFQCLYDWEDITDKNNSLNSLIYRLRKQLVAAGLPEEEYISIRNGICFWCGSMEVKVDSARMEELAQKAWSCFGEQKEKLLKEAYEIYQGEFLPLFTGETWVAVENTRLKKLYENVVHELCRMLRERGDYRQTLEICNRAAHIYPYEDWQAYQIDCLIELEEYEKAYQVYRDAVKQYSQEFGLPPSEPLLEQFQRLRKKLVNQESNLMKVKDQLNESMEGFGAYYCSYLSFIDTYRFLCRNVQRSGESIFLMLCSLQDTSHLGKKDKNAQGCLLRAIGETLRKGDIYTRYSNSQVLILLSRTKSENCGIIFQRICDKFKELNKNSLCQVSYEVTGVYRMLGEYENPEKISFKKSAW